MRELLAPLRSEKNFIYSVFGFSLLLRLAYAIKTGAGGLSPDAYDWMNTAWSVASGHGFGGSWRPPGYIFFLTAVFKVFGKSVIAAKAAQALLGAATVLLSYASAKLLFNERTARVTAALASFYPYFVAYAGDLLSETLLTFMIALSIWTIARAAARPAFGRSAAAGVAMGLTALTKSTVLPFFLLACAWLWWSSGRFRAALLAGIFVMLTILPWSLRNYFSYDGSYVMPVNTPWFSLYGSSCDEALAADSQPERNSPSGDETDKSVVPPKWDYVSSLPLPERDKYCREKALSWIKDNPGKFRRLIYLRALHFWRLYPLMAWPWQKRVAMATSGIYIPLSFAGLALGWKKYKGTQLLAALFASYTFVHLFFVVTLRYRIPIDTFVIMAAALAVDAATGMFPRPAQGGR